MSIATEISRIQQAKADIKSSIEAKGVTVPSSALIDDYSDYVDAIQTGGGGGTPIAVSKDVSNYIGGASFNFLSQITGVNWPSGITSISDSSFSNCRGLTSITIPNSVKSIGSSAFNSCSSMTSVTIGNNVKSIGSNAFFFCTGLTSVTIPNSVTSIGGSAFIYCYGLTSVTIGNSVTSIGGSAFNSCSGLTSITIKATTPPTLANNNAFTNTNNCPIYVPAESVETYKAASGWSSLASRIQAIPSE